MAVISNIGQQPATSHKIQAGAQHMAASDIEVFPKARFSDKAAPVNHEGVFLGHTEMVEEAQRLIASADKSQSNWDKILIEQIMSSNKYNMTTRINICNEIRKYNG